MKPVILVYQTRDIRVKYVSEITEEFTEPGLYGNTGSAPTKFEKACIVHVQAGEIVLYVEKR